MIVIPMAGDSRRFKDTGYECPKFMLDAHGRTLFEHAVRSFEAYFKTHPFLFVVRADHAAKSFVKGQVTELGIADWECVVLDSPTMGQADTVLQGLNGFGVKDSTAVTVFNIDTFRPGFRFPEEPEFRSSDGFLEVFRGQGEQWSFVAPAGPASNCVAETTEKRRISDYCCTGLYHFARFGDFRRAMAAPHDPQSPAEVRERYVAPLYNQLITWGRDIRFTQIDSREVIFCGTPAEYQNFLTRS